MATPTLWDRTAITSHLGMRRANAVVSYLSTLGISRSRLEAVVSFGETQPLIVTQGRERRNRRTVTEVSGFVHAIPLCLDGKYAQIIYREYVASAVPANPVSGGDGGGLSSQGPCDPLPGPRRPKGTQMLINRAMTRDRFKIPNNRAFLAPFSPQLAAIFSSYRTNVSGTRPDMGRAGARSRAKSNMPHCAKPL